MASTPSRSTTLTSTLPSKEGHVEKYRNVFLGWARIYLRLDRSYLHYYVAQYAPSPRKSIVRCDITSVKQINVAEKNHCIELVCGSERWQLSTYTQEELHQWIRVLTAHLPDREVQANLKEIEADSSEPSVLDDLPAIPDYMQEMQESEQPSPPSYDECI